MPEGWEKVSGSVLDVQYLKGTANFLEGRGFWGTNLDRCHKSSGRDFSASFDGYTRSGEPEAISMWMRKDARKLTFTCSVSQYENEILFASICMQATGLFAMTFADLCGYL